MKVGKGNDTTLATSGALNRGPYVSARVRVSVEERNEIGGSFYAVRR